MNKNSVLSLTFIDGANAQRCYRQRTKPAPYFCCYWSKVQSHQISQSLSLVGKLKAQQSGGNRPEVTGKVNVIAVQANQLVKKASYWFNWMTIKHKRLLVEAKAYLQDEQRKLSEYERLLKRNAITPTEIDAQRAQWKLAKQD